MGDIMKIKLKNCSIVVSLIFSMFISILAYGNIANAKIKKNIDTSDFTEIEGEQGDVINGVDVNNNLIQSRDVIVYNNFSSYNGNNRKTINKFRKIASATYKNATGSKQNLMLTISHSESKGAEWNGDVSFTGEIKAGILGSIQTQVGFGVKGSRSKDEAVGYEYSMTVSPHCIGTITAYYKGVRSYGKLKTYSYNTANPSKKAYSTTNINATVYKKSLDIYAESSEKKY